MRVQLKGIHRVQKRLAGGQVQTYYYAWRGGPRLTGDPGSPDFVISFQKAHEERRRPIEDTLKGLLAEYASSGDFQRLSPSSQREYRRYFAKIEAAFGDMPLAALEDRRARGEFKKWRDQWADKPRTADYAWMVLARTISWGKDRGRVRTNPCERGGRLYQSDRSEIVWTEADIGRFMAVAPDHLKVALLIGLWTGQRIGDLRVVTWSAYDGEFIRLKQSKTGRRVAIRVGAPLKAVLDALPRRAVTILTTERGTTWTHFGFQSSWRKAVAKAGLGDLHFHDLRGSAVSRLAEAGCTEAEIASITGHALQEVGKMLDRYLNRSEKLAEAAILKLEVRTVRDQNL